MVADDSSVASADSSIDTYRPPNDDASPPPSGPVTIAAGPSGEAARGVAVDATRVYWVTAGLSGSVLSVLKDGGGMTTIATDQASPLDIAVIGTSVYWSVTPAGAGSQCMAMLGSTPSASGGDAGPSCVAASADVTVRMTLGGANIVLLAKGTGANANNEYIGVPATGASFAGTLTQGPSQAIAATSQQVLLGNANGDHVDELALTGMTFGGAVCLTGCGSAMLVDMTMDVATENVLWITQNGGVFTAPLAVPSSGPNGSELVQIGTGSLTRMARDASYVYVTALGSSIVAVPLARSGDAGTFVTLASGEVSPFGIAVDESAVYWGDAEGRIRKTSVPGP